MSLRCRPEFPPGPEAQTDASTRSEENPDRIDFQSDSLDLRDDALLPSEDRLRGLVCAVPLWELCQSASSGQRRWSGSCNAVEPNGATCRIDAAISAATTCLQSPPTGQVHREESTANDLAVGLCRFSRTVLV